MLTPAPRGDAAGRRIPDQHGKRDPKARVTHLGERLIHVSAASLFPGTARRGSSRTAGGTQVAPCSGTRPSRRAPLWGLSCHGGHGSVCRAAGGRPYNSAKQGKPRRGVE